MWPRDKYLVLSLQLSNWTLVSKDRQAGSEAAAFPPSTQRSGSAPPPFPTGLLSGHCRKLICHHNKNQLRSFAVFCSPGSSLPGHSVDASLSSSASQPPPPSDLLVVKDRSYDCGTDCCPQLKKKGKHLLCLTSVHLTGCVLYQL